MKNRTPEPAPIATHKAITIVVTATVTTAPAKLAPHRTKPGVGPYTTRVVRLVNIFTDPPFSLPPPRLRTTYPAGWHGEPSTSAHQR